MDKVKFLQEFAESIGCIFVSEGEVGFGRSCVGILEPTIECYVDINPIDYDTTPIESYLEAYIFGYDEDLQPNLETVPNAYHKHNCMSVLTIGDDFAESTNQLYTWVTDILSKGEVQLVKYQEMDVESMDEIERMFNSPYKIALTYKNKY